MPSIPDTWKLTYDQSLSIQGRGIIPTDEAIALLESLNNPRADNWIMMIRNAAKTGKKYEDSQPLGTQGNLKKTGRKYA